MITSAFTCTGPYAILILTGIKSVENRSDNTAVVSGLRGGDTAPYCGRCAISVSKKFCKEEFGRFIMWASLALCEEDFAALPSWGDVKGWPGKIIGACDYEVVSRDEYAKEIAAERGGFGETVLPWDEGYAWFWKLSEVVAFDTPIPCRGNVGMWTMPEELAREVAAADEA